MRLKWIVGIAAILVIALIVTVIAILSSYDFNKFKPMITHRVRHATGRDVTLGGDIDLKIGFTPTLVVENVSFQNAQWGSRPELAKVRRFEVQVALLPLIGRNIEVKRLVLVEPDILIETDNLGKSNVDFRPTKRPEDKKTEKAEALPVLGLREVSITNGRFTYKDGRSKKAHSIALKRLDAISEGLDSPMEMELRGTYNDNPFELTGTFGPFHALVAPDKAWPLNFTLNIADTTVSVDGTMTDTATPKGISLSIDVEGRSVVNIAKLAEVKNLPHIGPFKVGLKVSDPQPKTYKISDLKLSFENNDLSGSAQISLINKRPELMASLSSTSLDLRPILSKEKSSAERKGTAEQPEQKRDKVFPNDPLPLDGLNYADAKVQFQADRVMLPRLALHDLTFNLVLRDGRLTVDPINSFIGGGNLQGKLELHPQRNGAAMATTLKVKELDLGIMLKELGVDDIVQGKLDADIDVKGHGNSIAALMAGLNGKTVFVTGEGKINNKYIGLLGKDLTNSVFRLLNPTKDKGAYTEGNCFVCGFHINDGLADATALVFDTPNMTVIGDGHINLKTEALDLSLKPSPKEGVAGLSLSLGELAKPFKLRGTLADPSLAIDTTQSALTIGKAVGGTVLFGPVGIVSALATGTKGDKNPCLAAIEAAKKGVKASGKEKKGTVDKATEGVKGAVEGAGRKLKKLFGK